MMLILNSKSNSVHSNVVPSSQSSQWDGFYVYLAQIIAIIQYCWKSRRWNSLEFELVWDRSVFRSTVASWYTSLKNGPGLRMSFDRGLCLQGMHALLTDDNSVPSMLVMSRSCTLPRQFYLWWSNCGLHVLLRKIQPSRLLMKHWWDSLMSFAN